MAETPDFPWTPLSREALDQVMASGTAPQDRPGTPALADLAFAALRPGTDTAREE